MKILIAVLGASALSLTACGGDRAPGTLAVSIYGESFIEEEIPAEEFVDGWSVTFERFLVSAGEVSAASGHEEPAMADPAYRVFDLARSSAGAGHPVFVAEVPGGFYDHVEYRIAPAAGAGAGNADAADVDLMTSSGYALYAEGTAVRGSEVLSFAWGFPTATTYRGCRASAEVDGAEAAAELTLHADHLFYDDLVSEEPNVAFDLVARADAEGDADGEVTREELAALDITGEERYQVGSFEEVTDLWTFIDYQTSTIGHIDGEGHCEEAVRE